MKYKGKDYQVLDSKKCKGKDCFVPFYGNGIYICRLYELGQCPKTKKTTISQKEK